MYIMNPIILGKADSIGRLAPGMLGDVVISRVNPLEDIAGLAAADAVSQVIQRGRLVG